jgi:arginase
VSIAGDCVATMGVLAGLHDAGITPTLIWFDAHGDFNTWETTPSGFLGGMPLAMIVGRGEQTMPHGWAGDPLPNHASSLPARATSTLARKKLWLHRR